MGLGCVRLLSKFSYHMTIGNYPAKPAQNLAHLANSCQRRQPTILAWVRRPEALGVKMRRRVRDDFLDGRGRLGRAPWHRPQRNVPGGVDHRETVSVRLNNPVTYASEAGLDRTDGPPHPT